MTDKQTADASPPPAVASAGRDAPRPILSLRSELVLWFAVVALVPMLIVGVVTGRFLRHTVHASAAERLAEVARGRLDAIESAVAERARLVGALSSEHCLTEACREARSTANAPAMDELWRSLCAAFPSSDIVILDAEGAPIRSSSERWERGDSESLAIARGAFAAAVERARLAGTVIVADVFHSRDELASARTPEGADESRTPLPTPSTTTPWVIGPLVDRSGDHAMGHETERASEEGRLVGHLAIELSDKDLALALSDHEAIGAAGDVIAVTRIGERWWRCAPHPAPLAWQVDSSTPTGDGKRSSIGDVATAAGIAERIIESDGVAHLAAAAPAPSLGWTIVARRPEADVLAPLGRLTAMWWQAMFAGVALAVALALGAARRIAQPIGEAVAAARRLADGDLTLPPATVGRGESLDLLRALRATNDQLTETLERVRAASGTIVRSTGDVLGSARHEEHAVREFAASVQQVAAETSQINAVSRQLSTTMVGLARSAEFAATTATAGRTALVDLGKQMGRLNEGGRGVASRLEAIRERAARIDSMVAAITKVANQTNLLAVNAAIEAEKAGVVGHGFQVVAREIDRLATQTAASVLEIEETVIAVQQAVTEGVVEMSHFIDLVDDGCGTANGVASQMGLIIRQAEELRAEFEQVAHSVESQSQGVEQVNAAMARVAEGATRTAAAVDRSAAVSAALDDAARELESNIRHFRLPVR